MDRAAGVSEWSQAPLTLRAYVVLSVVNSSVVAIVADGPIAPRLFLVGLSVVVAFFLLRGVRWLWIVITALTVLGLLTSPLISGAPTWHGTLLGVLTLVLLLVPTTRRYFAQDVAPANAPG